MYFLSGYFRSERQVITIEIQMKMRKSRFDATQIIVLGFIAVIFAGTFLRAVCYYRNNRYEKSNLMFRQKNEHLKRHSKEDFGPWTQFLKMSGIVFMLFLAGAAYVAAALLL